MLNMHSKRGYCAQSVDRTGCPMHQRHTDFCYCRQGNETRRRRMLIAELYSQQQVSNRRWTVAREARAHAIITSEDFASRSSLGRSMCPELRAVTKLPD